MFWDNQPDSNDLAVRDFECLDFCCFAIILKNSAVIWVGDDIEDTRLMAGVYIALNTTGLTDTISELEAKVSNAPFVRNLRSPVFRDAETGFFLVPCTGALADQVESIDDRLFYYVECEEGICLVSEAPFTPN